MGRLGVRLETGPQYAPRDVVEMAGLAEEQGYETVWVPEGAGTDALTQLTAISGSTSKVRLGTGILPIYFRTPTLLAMSAASLDDISQGRFILGLGVGHRGTVESVHGTPFDRPLRRMRETVEIVRRLLRGERVTFEGRVFKLHGSSLGLNPERPDLPIYLAALRPQMIELAGEIADGVLLNMASPTYLQQAVEHLRIGANRAGRVPQDVDVACYVRTAVVDDPARARPAFQRLVARYFSMPFYRDYFSQCGFGEEVAAASRALELGDTDGAADVISDTMQSELGIFGSAEHCRREVEARRALGLRLPVIAPFVVAGEPRGSFRATIAAFSG